MKLSSRILAVAFVNLALLAGIFLAFAHYQFHLTPASFLVAPAEDRVRDVARSVASDLTQTQPANRTSLMARYAGLYGVDFYLFDNDGPQLAGKPVQLPPGVKRELAVRAVDEQQPPRSRPAPPPPVHASSPAHFDRPPPRKDRPPPRSDGPPPRGDRPPPPDGPPPQQGDWPPPPPDGPPARGYRPPPGPYGAGPDEPPYQHGPGASDDMDPPRPRNFSAPPPPPPPPHRARARVDASGRAGPAATSGAENARPTPSIANAGYQTMQRPEAGLYWAMTRIPVFDPSTKTLVRGTLLMVAPSFWGTPLFFDFRPWLAALAAAIAVFILCWLPFIRGLSRSISRLTDNTRRIAQGDFENHLPENRRDEIGQLSVSINRMAGRLAGFVTGQKRFLGDIAHELSAPIARIQFALGILDQRASEDQLEAVEDLREEIAHMSGLVGELLSFSKAGLHTGGTALRATEVAPIIRQAAAREGSGRQIVLAISEQATAVAEPNLLLRALSNLVRNAVRYAGPDGPITISTGVEGDVTLITIADSGAGLPADELDRVFTPFYRLDASRTRETGGAGLGLAIVKSCIEASGGTVQCRNREPHGLEVEIRLKTVL